MPATIIIASHRELSPSSSSSEATQQSKCIHKSTEQIRTARVFAVICECFAVSLCLCSGIALVRMFGARVSERARALDYYVVCLIFRRCQQATTTCDTARARARTHEAFVGERTRALTILTTQFLPRTYLDEMKNAPTGATATDTPPTLSTRRTYRCCVVDNDDITTDRCRQKHKCCTMC